MKKDVLAIKQITFSQELYPRHNTDWIVIHKYRESMKVKGANFPPITVAKWGKTKYFLIDGQHRLEAMKGLKEQYVQCEILTGLNKKQMFIEAVKRNNRHGNGLSGRDKARIIQKLQEMKLDVGEISKLVMIPKGKLEIFKDNRMSFTPTGKPVALKRPLMALAQTEVSEDFEEIQRPIRSVNSAEIFNSVITFLQSGALVLDKNSVSKLKLIRSLINKALKK